MFEIILLAVLIPTIVGFMILRNYLRMSKADKETLDRIMYNSQQIRKSFARYRSMNPDTVIQMSKSNDGVYRARI